MTEKVSIPTSWRRILRYFLNFPEATYLQYLNDHGSENGKFSMIQSIEMAGYLTVEYKDGQYYIHVIKEKLPPQMSVDRLQSEVDAEAGIIRDPKKRNRYAR